MQVTLNNSINQESVTTNLEEYNFDILADEFHENSELIKFLEEKREKLKKRLESYLDLTEKSSWVGKKFVLTYVKRKGTIDYSIIPELKHIDLESFRKEPVRYLKLIKLEGE